MRKITAFLILVIFCSINLIVLNGCSKSENNEKFIDTLRQFKSMTSYSKVVEVLGEPSVSISAQQKEWKNNNGTVRITFAKNKTGSIYYVRRVTFINNRGETEYFYKLLID
jgi:hypothetical protein